MNRPGPARTGHDREEYLCVDHFISNLIGARGLATALELGLIDRLQQAESMGMDSLRQELRLEPRAFEFLLDLLRINQVVEGGQGGVRLTGQFRSALRFRDLLEAKLAFAQFVLRDFTEDFTSAITDPDRFFQNSRVLDLFSYGRCLDLSPQNISHTRRWVRITSCLTRYEAGACMRHYDFSRHRRLLDVGGNSGEMALQICRKVPGATATVFDLPVVCEIGKAHVRGEPEAKRIGFVSGNALTDELPGGFDLVLFKSMLHDWPEEAARRLISKAALSLDAGGTLLVFERAPIVVGGSCPDFSMIPFLLFFRSFRSPAVYEDELKHLGFDPIRIQTVRLETDFSLLTATRRICNTLAL